jgi:hypothetical protein
MVSKTRTDAFIESEQNKVKIMALLNKHPLSRSQLCLRLDISKMQMHNLLKALCGKGYIKIHDESYFCTVSNRTMCSYAPTGLPYVGRDLKEIEIRAEKNKLHRERRAAQGPRTYTKNPAREGRPKKPEPVVVKVDEHTTIYYNSRRPSSDFTMKKEEKSRRNSKVAMGSSMEMFWSW